MKFNKAQNLAVKQCQDKTRFLQKRQQENTARVARGEDPLPEEDVNKLFKPLPPQNRWGVKDSGSLSIAERYQYPVLLPFRKAHYFSLSRLLG